jgi:hypothetical protein
MATYDLRKTTKASSGQKIRKGHSNNSQNKTEERVVILESKLDKILNLLENKKENN